MIVALGLWLGLALAAPWALDDTNSFLKNFVNHEFLNFLGVVVTVTLAVAGQIHLSLNRLEEQAGKRFLTKTRSSVHRSAVLLIGVLGLAVILAVAKPLFAFGPVSQALANGAALLIILINALILWDLTALTFKIEPQILDEEE